MRLYSNSADPSPLSFLLSSFFNILFMKVTHEIAAYTATGEPVFLFKVVNGTGAYVEFTNWGARWITAAVRDSRL